TERARGNFDAGIRAALERVLVSPDFLFRIEADPPNAATNSVYLISDVELASRLSFFLWSSIPDDELLTWQSLANYAMRTFSTVRCGACWRTRGRESRWCRTFSSSGWRSAMFGCSRPMQTSTSHGSMTTCELRS